MVKPQHHLSRRPLISLSSVISYYARKMPGQKSSFHTYTDDVPLSEARVFEGMFVVAHRELKLTFITEAGWIGRDAILMTGINAIIYLLSTLPT